MAQNQRSINTSKFIIAQLLEKFRRHGHIIHPALPQFSPQGIPAGFPRRLPVNIPQPQQVGEAGPQLFHRLKHRRPFQIGEQVIL